MRSAFVTRSKVPSLLQRLDQVIHMRYGICGETADGRSVRQNLGGLIITANEQAAANISIAGQMDGYATIFSGLSINLSTPTQHGGLFKATTGISVEGPTTLSGNVSLATDGAAGHDIKFTAGIGGSSATDLTLYAGTSGDVKVNGSIGAGPPVGAVTVTGADVNFGETLGGAVQADSLSVTATGMITVEGDVTATGGSIVLNNPDFSATNVPTTATVFASNLAGTTFTANDSFTMSPGAKLTSFGDLTISANTATLGDLVSIGTMTVNANTIALLRRSGGTVLTSTGGLSPSPDTGVDYVAGGSFAFKVAPTPSGSDGGAPQFASLTTGADANGTRGGYTMLRFPSNPGVSVSVLEYVPNNNILSTLDLIATGTPVHSTSSLASANGAAQQGAGSGSQARAQNGQSSGTGSTTGTGAGAGEEEAAPAGGG